LGSSTSCSIGSPLAATTGCAWLCERRTAASRRSAPTPSTGFAFPTVIGSANEPELITGSLGPGVRAVSVRAGSTPVPVTYHDTATGRAPRLFVALVERPGATPVHVTATDASGRVRQRVTING
jgi:hypothetical protein